MGKPLPTISRKVAELETHLASPAFLERHGVPRKAAQLSEYPCVTFDILGTSNEWRFRKPGAKTELPVVIHSRLVVNTAEAAIDAARAGLGVTRVLSYQVTQGACLWALGVLRKHQWFQMFILFVRFVFDFTAGTGRQSR